MNRRLVVCALGAVIAASAGPVPDVEQVLARYQQAIGGKAALARLKTLVRKGHLVHGDARVPFEWHSSFPDKWRGVSIWPRRGIAIVAFDGKLGWRLEARPPAQRLSRDEAALESLIHDARVVSRLKGVFSSLSATRAETRDGRQVYVITARRRGDVDERVFPSDPEVVFDAATGLLLQLGPVRFDDYREAGGVKLAHRISLSGDHMVYQVTEVLPNAPLGPAEFEVR